LKESINLPIRVGANPVNFDKKETMAVQLITDADFENTIRKQPLVVVKYFADWCGNCKLFAPKFRRVSEEEAHQGVVFLDIDAENNPIARKAAGVDNLPFLAAFKNGVLLEGAASSKEEYLRELLNQLHQES
jgi:thioredoxin-like negative regulator of GroEL